MFICTIYVLGDIRVHQQIFLSKSVIKNAGKLNLSMNKKLADNFAIELKIIEFEMRRRKWGELSKNALTFSPFESVLSNVSVKNVI